MFLYMNSKNESVTSAKFGSSAGASNATEFSASGGGALPHDPYRGLCPLDPLWGSSRARHDQGSSSPKRNILASLLFGVLNCNYAQSGY